MCQKFGTGAVLSQVAVHQTSGFYTAHNSALKSQASPAPYLDLFIVTFSVIYLSYFFLIDYLTILIFSLLWPNIWQEALEGKKG